jgi:hypothetical protein
MADHRSNLISVKRVLLGRQHLTPGRTLHTIHDKDGSRPFPQFTSLEIAHHEGSNEYYLFHICSDGQVADTWHQSMADALRQAEWEFGVQSHEWMDIAEEFG